jgi:hypothetical protein
VNNYYVLDSNIRGYRKGLKKKKDNNSEKNNDSDEKNQTI